MNSVRERFEKWARGYFVPIVDDVVQRDGEIYRHAHIRMAWVIWQSISNFERAAGQADERERSFRLCQYAIKTCEGSTAKSVLLNLGAAIRSGKTGEANEPRT